MRRGRRGGGSWSGETWKAADMSPCLDDCMAKYTSFNTTARTATGAERLIRLIYKPYIYTSRYTSFYSPRFPYVTKPPLALLGDDETLGGQ